MTRTTGSDDATARTSRHRFAVTSAGEEVWRYSLANAGGTTVDFLDYGGTIVAIRTKDRQGTLADITLGFDTFEPYVGSPFYFGALIGRNANRIANASLAIDGERYALTRNDGAHNLHTGPHGFHAAGWRVSSFETARECGAELRHTSAAGDDGFPGLVEAIVRYTLTDDDELTITYEATTDTPTPVNLTQHTYFNLTGRPGSDVRDHALEVAASAYTPVSASLIPLGDHAPVDGTPFDLRRAPRIGDAMDLSHPQVALGNGYDHNFVLDTDRDVTRRAASLHDAESGRVVDLYTTERGVQIYAGGTFTPGLIGKGGAAYPTWGGIALETQAFPDAPNQPAFPSTILYPHQRYHSTTVWRFGVR